MATDGRGHKIRSGAPSPTGAAPGRLEASLRAAAAEFSLSYEDLVEYIARNTDDTTERARGRDGAEDATYTRREFPDHVDLVLERGKYARDPNA